MKITMTMDVLAADVPRRIISGRIVPFNEIGTPNIGKTMFLEGSIQIPDVSAIKLNLEHDRTKPVGRAIAIESKADGIYADFKIAQTTAGSDALVEASENLRGSFSIEALGQDSEIIDGVTVFSRAELVGVALVTHPAFSSAEITKVAAAAEAEVTPVTEETITEEETVSETTAPVEAIETIEASTPAVGVAFTAPRSPVIDAGSYLEHSIKAQMGDEDSRQYVRAADDSTTTNTGLTLPNHLNQFITTNFEGRPAIDAISKEALPSNGLSFTIPTLGTKPTVAAVAEEGAPSETGMTSTYITVDIAKYYGKNEVSFELLDRSNPAFFAELVRQMRYAYAKATDAAVLASLVTNGTASTGVAATAAGLQSFIATESAAAFKATGEYASNLIASPDVWGSIMGFADSTGRPLYFANNPANNPGAVTGNSVVGNVLDKALYVDSNVSASGFVDDSAFLVAPNAVTWYESPTTQLQVNLLNTGQVQIGLYGYGAIAIKKAGGIRRLNIA
jgi:HK97 family phage major capsid protein